MIAFSSSVVLVCASTIIWPKPFTGADCPLLAAIRPASNSYMSLTAAFWTKSGVLGAPHDASHTLAHATISRCRISASKSDVTVRYAINKSNARGFL